MYGWWQRSIPVWQLHAFSEPIRMHWFIKQPMNLLYILCKEYIVSNNWLSSWVRQNGKMICPTHFLLKKTKFCMILSHSCIKQIDSMLPCVCSVIDHRRHQNVVRILVTHFCFVCLFFVLTTFYHHLWCITYKGIASGVPGVPVTPLCKFFFNQTTYNIRNMSHKAETRRWGRHGNLVSTLTLTQCDPPFEKSWLRPWLNRRMVTWNLSILLSRLLENCICYDDDLTLLVRSCSACWLDLRHQL